MHLKRLRITNFRSIDDVDVEIDSLVNVIIGPNAVGKTTILEAIRLCKAVLAPRTANESSATLQALGITSPHMPSRIFPNSLTNKPNQPTTVRCKYAPHSDEIMRMRDILPQLVPIFAQQSVGLNFANPAQAMGFLSSPQGQAACLSSRAQLNSELAKIASLKSIELNLTINYETGLIAGEFPIQQALFSALEQQLPPRRTIFSYFPADRALPIGEQPVQLGSADTSQQMESYNSQPQIKYNRLKNAIFNTIITAPDGRSKLETYFSLIFSKILTGRRLGDIGINELGMLSIPILDTETNKIFDIDGLSSGEKGLILTFLLIATSIEKHGIILLDEPELHLNPAVCKDLLQFLVDEYAFGQDVQIIVCSHSAEILAGSFERDQCSLFHLKGARSLAKVRRKDQGEIRDALRRLGSSESEALLYRGTVLVEGIHDVEVLEAGFDQIFRRYRLKQRGGRINVEQDIRELLRAEEAGDEIGSYYFIFDHDAKPTNLVSSVKVRLLQLQLYCLENYLLDAEIITDLSQDKDFSPRRFGNVTETRDLIKQVAMSQLKEVAARETFKIMGLEAIRFDMKALQQPDADQVAQNFGDQVEVIIGRLQGLTNAGFVTTFTREFDQLHANLSIEWDSDWSRLCNGKNLFEELRLQHRVAGDLLRVKQRIIKEMKQLKTDTWRSLNGQLTALVEEA